MIILTEILTEIVAVLSHCQSLDGSTVVQGYCLGWVLSIVSRSADRWYITVLVVDGQVDNW